MTYEFILPVRKQELARLIPLATTAPCAHLITVLVSSATLEANPCKAHANVASPANRLISHRHRQV